MIARGRCIPIPFLQSPSASIPHGKGVLAHKHSQWSSLSLPADNRQQSGAGNAHPAKIGLFFSSQRLRVAKKLGIRDTWEAWCLDTIGLPNFHGLSSQRYGTGTRKSWTLDHPSGKRGCPVVAEVVDFLVVSRGRFAGSAALQVRGAVVVLVAAKGEVRRTGTLHDWLDRAVWAL